jgi:Amt family ammonium transporter
MSILSFVAIPSVCVIYGGRENISRSLGLSWSVAAPISLLWGVVAFSMVYGKSDTSGVVGGLTFATINKVGSDLTIPYYSFMYAMTAMAIIVGGAGAHSGLRTAPFQLFMAGSLLLNYAPLAHWFWNANGWAFKWGVIDFAGGMVLHGYAGTAVLVLGLLSKSARERPELSSAASILAALGFFVGKQALQAAGGSSDGQWSSLGAYNTIIGAYGGALVFNVLGAAAPLGGGGAFKGAAGASNAVKGALVGTVTMTAGAAYQEPLWAVLSTVAASAIVYAVDYFSQRVDVAGVDCFVMHGVAGFVGSAMAGLFANNKGGRLFVLGSPYAQNYAGAFFGSARQLGLQLAGVAFTFLLTVAMTAGLLVVVHAVFLPFGGAWEAGAAAAPAAATLSLRQAEAAAAKAPAAAAERRQAEGVLVL